MSRVKGGQHDVPCASVVNPMSVDFSDMPPLLEIPGHKPKLFDRFRSLIEKNETAMKGGPGVFSKVQREFFSLLTDNDDVKNGSREIFAEMFKIQEEHTNSEYRQFINDILDCILEANLNKLSYSRCLQMLYSLFSKAFYKDSFCRIILGSSFVLSTVYLTWISGIGQIFGLGVDGCYTVFSALSACYQFIDNPILYVSTFERLIGDYAKQIPDFIKILNENVDKHAVFVSLIAQTNVAILDKIYRPAPAPEREGDARAGAGAGASGPGAGAGANEPGYFNELLKCIQELKNKGGSPEKMNELEKIRLATEQANNALNGPSSAPGPSSAAGVHAAGAVPDQKTLSLFQKMYDEIKIVTGQYSEYVKEYLRNLYRFLNKVLQVFPGVVGDPNNSFCAYTSNFFIYYLTDVVNAIKRQMGTAGINETETILGIILDFSLPSPLRNEIYMGKDYTASQEVIMLALTLKDDIINCLAKKINQSQGRTMEFAIKSAKKIIENVIPFYQSLLTEDNLKKYMATLPDEMLRRFLTVSGQNAQPQPFDDTQGGTYGDSQPEEERNESLYEDMILLFRKGLLEPIQSSTDKTEKNLYEKTMSACTSLLRINPFSLFLNPLQRLINRKYLSRNHFGIVGIHRFVSRIFTKSRPFGTVL